MNFLKSKQKKISHEDSEGDQADCEELEDPKGLNLDFDQMNKKFEEFDLEKVQGNIKMMPDIDKKKQQSQNPPDSEPL